MNSVKSRIDKQDVSPSCRMCGEREETVGHIVAECKMLAQKYYKNWRHDNGGASGTLATMQELWTRKRGRLVQARAQASDRKRTDKNTMGFLHSNGSSNRRLIGLILLSWKRPVGNAYLLTLHARLTPESLTKRKKR